jgi:hypothetical protein
MDLVLDILIVIGFALAAFGTFLFCAWCMEGCPGIWNGESGRHW